MSNIRGGHQFANAVVLGVNGVTAAALIKPLPYVCLFVSNTGGTTSTFQVQVATWGEEGPTTEDDSELLAGLTWFDLSGKTLAVTNGTSGALDLSPFASPLLRLKSSAATTISAWYTAVGT